jgi:hypothetical protein
MRWPAGWRIYRPGRLCFGSRARFRTASLMFSGCSTAFKASRGCSNGRCSVIGVATSPGAITDALDSIDGIEASPVTDIIPAVKAGVDTRPRTSPLGQITPRCTRPQLPEDTIDYQPVVLAYFATQVGGQPPLQACPNYVTQPVPIASSNHLSCQELVDEIIRRTHANCR